MVFDLAICEPTSFVLQFWLPNLGVVLTIGGVCDLVSSSSKESHTFRLVWGDLNEMRAGFIKCTGRT